MQNNFFYKIIFWLIVVFFLPTIALASETDGTIDNVYKYAWGENIGWVNFGASNGNVHVTDSGLSGYALSENVGWIYLSGITNDGQGNLSGTAWSENTGWINFKPTNGGVIINSSGEFTGSAFGENVGWIIFSGDYKVKTDYRPKSARSACNNSSDDDSDGKTDYPADPGCSSLDDTDETDAGGGGGLPSVAYNSPVTPSGGFSISIQDDAKYTNSRNVTLKLNGGSDVKKIAISNTGDFTDASQEDYQTQKQWDLCSKLGGLIKFPDCSEGIHMVYIKFYTQYGQSSQVVSDEIILDTTAPEIKIIGSKDYYSPVENVVLSAQTEPQTEVVLHWSDKYGLTFADSSGRLNINLGQLPTGIHQLEFKLKDLAGNISNISIDINVSWPLTETVIKPIVIAPKYQPIAKPEIAPQSPSTEPAIIVPPAPAEGINEEPVPSSEPAQEMIIIQEQAPSVMQGAWALLSRESIRSFVLAPLPREIRDLVHKFPKLEETLNKIGITKVTDVDKLKTVKLTLPGLTERAGLSKLPLVPGKFAALPKGIPVSDLPLQAKQALPTDIVFAKTGAQLIDFNITLQVNDKGQPQQKIATISGKPLQLAVKPDEPVTSVKGYLVFRAKAPQVSALQLKLEQLAVSFLFVNPVFAQDQEKPVRQEERLVLLEFDYTDPDGDGIYTAEIQAPLAEGEYEIITVMYFEDQALGAKEIRLITVVDPEGYIYELAGGKETRIPGAIVSIYWFNSSSKQYELWPAGEFQQDNPQITDLTGKYSFLVPEGSYYLKVEAPGYPDYVGKVFQIKEGSGVHFNIALRTKYWYLKIVDFRTVLLALVVLFLGYNFYRDKIREKLFKKSNLIK